MFYRDCGMKQGTIANERQVSAPHASPADKKEASAELLHTGQFFRRMKLVR